MRRATAVGIGVVLLIGLTGVVGAVGSASGGPTDAGTAAVGPLADGTSADPCWEDPLDCTGTGPTFPGAPDDTDNDGLPED